MTTTLGEQVDLLKRSLPALQQRRTSNPFANDVYEAAVYWRDLGQWILNGDDRIDYPARSREEKALLEKLTKLLRSMPSEEQERYAEVFEAAKGIIAHAEATPASQRGHLGTLAVIRAEFSFLQTDYGFEISDEQPMGIHYSSGTVYVDLQFSKEPSLSCSFGLESQNGTVFWVDDLLFLYGDARYRTLPRSLKLDTEGDVQAWFHFVADVFRRYGHEVLTNQPAIFDRLAFAQAERDRENIAATE